MIQFLTGIQNTTSALQAERTRLDVISQNIANVNTTRDVDGGPYQRRVVIFEAALNNALNSQNSTGGVSVSRIEKDSRTPRLIYNPGHPEANADGMVALPNINIHEEMADLIASSRAYEANLAVVKNARMLAMQTLSLGRR